MNGRLYRLTPAGGKPNHYTDSYASIVERYPDSKLLLAALAVGLVLILDGDAVERVA